MKIGLAGTGRMGAAIAGRLAALGHDVAVWNRTASRAESLGLPIERFLANLVSRSETIITMLADGTAVKDVYARFSGDLRGKLFIDMSTVRPSTCRSSSITRRSAKPCLCCRGLAFPQSA